MILPLTGKQYSEKVAENCVAYWKSIDKYSDAESKAIDKFLEVFKDETFPPGASILFTQSPSGSLTISFSKDGSIPEHGNAVIENKQMSEAVLESIIGKHGVSPAAKQSLGAAAGKLDGIIDTVSTTHALVPLLSLLKPHSKLILVGAPKKPLELPVFPLIMGRKMITASATGGLKEVQEMIDFDFFQIGILMIFMPCFNVLFVGFVMMRFGLYRLNLSVACI